MIHEMKRSLSKVTDTDEGWKQINYFTNNQDRMDPVTAISVGRSAVAWSKGSAN